MPGFSVVLVHQQFHQLAFSGQLVLLTHYLKEGDRVIEIELAKIEVLRIRQAMASSEKRFPKLSGSFCRIGGFLSADFCPRITRITRIEGLGVAALA